VALRATLILIGFTAAIGQIVLMREFLVVFHGNELSLGVLLASWLLWTALGSSVAARLRFPSARVLAAVLLALEGLVLPLTVVAVRSCGTLFHRMPGELLGPRPVFTVAAAGLSVFCGLSGWLFAAGSRLWAEETAATIARASSSAYLFDALGSGVGGLLASLLLIGHLTSIQIALLLALVNVVVAIALAVPGARPRRVALIACVAVFAGLVFPLGAPWMERASLARLWPGFQLMAVRDSVYGNLAVVETEGSRTLFENGAPAFSSADPAAAEEDVHFALLEHPRPTSLLLIGGGVNGSLAQALQHRSLERLDYVELDPAILSIARQYFPSAWSVAQDDPRVRVHNVDARLFLKTTDRRFDVIVVNLPDPHTAQLNRFYTAEFFSEAARKLAPGGVFSIRLSGAENYISAELANFLRCINKTLRAVFPEVTALPGATIHFFAAERPRVLARDAGEILARLRQRRLATRYVREYYIPFQMMPDRLLDLNSQIEPRADTPVNHDFAPIAYYFQIGLWSSRFNREWEGWLDWAAHVPFGRLAAAAAALLLALAGAARFAFRKPGRTRAIAALSVAAMGFTLIALELLLLLAFQAIYGYVYQQLAILIGCLMAGMALGTWLGLRWLASSPAEADSQPTRTQVFVLAAVQAAAAISALLCYALVAGLARLASSLAHLALANLMFPALAASSGLLAGFQFPLASRVFFHLGTPAACKSTGAAGALYALDLAGACLGALLLSVYLVPVFGFLRTAILIAMVNLAPAALCGIEALGELKD
jgi:spermidine synthase